ncbi:RVT_3 domain-containing protein, partial [Cephalotus follicularis]
NKPLKQVLQKPDTLGRLVNWYVALGEYDIKYEFRPAIKAQLLVDFVTECTPTKERAEKSEEGPSMKNFWVLYVDGSSSMDRSRARLVLISPNGWTLQYALRFRFKATNNEVEYEAMIKGLTLTKHLEVHRIRILCDSQLVVNEMNGEYGAKDEGRNKYLAKVRSLISKFDDCQFVKIPREENNRANMLSKLALVEEIPYMGNMFREDLTNPVCQKSMM